MPQLDFSYYGVTISWSVLKLLLFVCFFELCIITFIGRSFRHYYFINFKNSLNIFSKNFEKIFYVNFIIKKYLSNILKYQKYFSLKSIMVYLSFLSKNISSLFFFSNKLNPFLILNIQIKKLLKNKTLSFFFITVLDLPYNGQMSFQDPATPIMEGIILFHHELLIIQIFIAIFVCWMLFRTVMLFRLKNFYLNKVVGDFFGFEYFIVSKDNMWDEKAKFIPALCDWFRFIFLVNSFKFLWNIDKDQLNIYKHLGAALSKRTFNYLKLNFFYGFILYLLKYRIVTFFEFFNNKDEEKKTFETLQMYWFLTYLYYDLRHKCSYNQSLHYISYIIHFKSACKINLEKKNLASKKDLLGYENRVPSKVRHHTLLESVWTIIPSIILIIIAIPSFALLYAMDELVAPAMTVHVMGNQWYWRYTYTLFRSNHFSFFFDKINNIGSSNIKLYYDGILKEDRVDHLLINCAKKDFFFENLTKGYSLRSKLWPMLKYPFDYSTIDFTQAIIDGHCELSKDHKWYFSDSFYQMCHISFLAYLDRFSKCARPSIFNYLYFLCSYPVNGLDFDQNKRLIRGFLSLMDSTMLHTLLYMFLYDLYIDDQYFSVVNNYSITKYFGLFFTSELIELNSLRFLYIKYSHNYFKFISLLYPKNEFEKTYFSMLSATVLNKLIYKIHDGYTFDEFIAMRKAGSNTYYLSELRGLRFLLEFYSNEVSTLTNFLGDFSNRTLRDLYEYISYKSNYFSIYYPSAIFISNGFDINNNNNLLIKSENFKELFISDFNSVINNNIKFDFLDKGSLSGSNFYYGTDINDKSIFSLYNYYTLNHSFLNEFYSIYDTCFKGISILIKRYNFLSLILLEKDLKFGIKNFRQNAIIFYKNSINNSIFYCYCKFNLNFDKWSFQNYVNNFFLYNLEEIDIYNKLRKVSFIKFFGKDYFNLNFFFLYLKDYCFSSQVNKSNFYFNITGVNLKFYPDMFSLKKALWFVDDYTIFTNDLLNNKESLFDINYKLNVLKGVLDFYCYSYLFGLAQLKFHSFEILYRLFFEDYTGFIRGIDFLPFGSIMDFLVHEFKADYTTLPLGLYFTCWHHEQIYWRNFLNYLFTYGFNENKFLKIPLLSKGLYSLFLSVQERGNKDVLNFFNLDLYFADNNKKRYFYNWNFLNSLVKKPVEFEDFISRKGRITFESRLKGDIDNNYFILPNKIGMYRLLDVDNVLVLPEKVSIRLLITSSDVLHSWAVPSLGIKLDACPGRLNQTSVYLKRIGTFYGQCSEICGINHAFMPIVVKSIPLISYTYMRALCFDKVLLSFFNKFDFGTVDIIKLLYKKK